MKHGWSFAWMLAMMLSACSGDKGREIPAASARVDKKASKVAPIALKKKIPETVAPLAAPTTSVMTIKRRLMIEAGDGTEGPAAAIALEVMSGDEVQGTLDLAGTPLALKGIKQENQLRLWVFGGIGDAATARRGYLMGTIEGDGIKGTIAISGNGGKPAMQGTWTSVD